MARAPLTGPQRLALRALADAEPGPAPARANPLAAMHQPCLVRPKLDGDYDVHWPAGLDPVVDYCTLDDLRWLAAHGASWLRILPAYSLEKPQLAPSEVVVTDASGRETRIYRGGDSWRIDYWDGRSLSSDQVRRMPPRFQEACALAADPSLIHRTVK